MKKKISTVLIGVFVIVITTALGGCIAATPTKENVINDLSKNWEVELPESIVLVNYSLNSGVRDYASLYIFEYADCEEEFTAQLSSEKNKDIEDFFTELCTKRKDSFNDEYSLPDIPEKYFWLYKYKADEYTVTRELYILYLPEENQILVYIFKL